MHKQLFSQSKTILLQLYLIHLLLHVRPEFKSIFVLNFASVFCVFLTQKKNIRIEKENNKKKQPYLQLHFPNVSQSHDLQQKGPEDLLRVMFRSG